MHCACEQFLACPAFAVDQHPSFRCCDHLGLSEYLSQLLVAGDDFRRPVFVYLARARTFHRAFDRFNQLFLVDRFGQEAECAALSGRDSIRDGSVGRYD